MGPLPNVQGDIPMKTKLAYSPGFWGEGVHLNNNAVYIRDQRIVEQGLFFESERDSLIAIWGQNMPVFKKKSPF